MVERRLGRGLDFFLSGSQAQGSGDEVQNIEVKSIVRSPYQTRAEFRQEDLNELAESIRVSGLLQPVLVRKKGSQYELIAGERRWRASQIAGLERIPALVRDLSNEAAAAAGLVENVQRADLNAIEKAQGFRRLLQLTKVSQDEIGRQVGLERSTVTNFLRLLELPEEVQNQVSRGTLSMGHARALLGLRSADEQKEVAQAVARKKLSVRQVEELVNTLNANAPASATDAAKAATQKIPKGRPVWLHEIEETLTEAVGAPVGVRYGRKRSRITIECGPREDFERVYELLKSLLTSRS